MKTVKPLLLITGLALAISACTSSIKTSDDASAANAPMLKGEIPVTTAKRLIAQFSPRAYKVPQGKDKHGRDSTSRDSRTVWFSREQLEALMKNVRDENCDGVRFYFAAYDKK